jgi:hypothetical protein
MALAVGASVGLAASSVIAADQASAPAPRSVWDDLRTGRDLLDLVPEVAVIEGSQSLLLQAATMATNQSLRGPTLRGALAHQTTRILYGTSWTAMLAGESLFAMLVSGGSLAWIGEAHWRSDMLFGYGVPSRCGSPGDQGGCGVGLGSLGGMYLRLADSKWWLEVSGGWVQQRVSNDATRTLAESTWIMTPLGVAREVVLGAGGPFELRALGGPGLHFGMHNAHVHPTLAGDDQVSSSWTEMVPLHAGMGPGARAELRLAIAQRLSLETEWVVAPLLLSRTETNLPSVLRPYADASTGLPTFRKLSLGASYMDRSVPMRVGLAWLGMEMSGRPITDLGHQAVMLRFDFPLREGSFH